MSFDERYRNWLKDHDPMGAQEFDYLDTIDIKSIIESNKDKDADSIIEDMYEEDYLAKYPNDEELFGSINSYEFVDYIYWRYKIRCTEHITYYFN